MKRALLDVDPLTGIRQYFAWDNSGNEYLIDEGDTTDTKRVLDQNKRIEGQGMGKDMRLAASVPPEVQMEWLTKYGVNMFDPNHKEAVRRLLNSNEYAHCRVNAFTL